MMRPGSFRTCSFLHAKNAACGPPYPSGTPKRCALPNAISAPSLRPGGSDEREREEIARHRDHRAFGVGAGDERSEVDDVSVGGGILHEDAEEPLGGAGGSERAAGVAHDDLDRMRRGSGAKDLDRLRVAPVGDEDGLPPAAARGFHHVHRLGRGRRLVEERRVGDLEGGEVAHHRLEVEEGSSSRPCEISAW